MAMRPSGRPLGRGLLCLLALAGPALAPAPAGAQRPKPHFRGTNLEFRGLAALNEFVLRAALELPRRVKTDEASVARLTERVLSFLHESGYELATVESSIEDRRVVLLVDEGRLDKIVFRDRGTFETLRLKLELALPGSVFNRPLVEQQLAALKKKYKLTKARYELIAVERSAERDEIAGPLRDLKGIDAFVPTAGGWELHLFIEQREWQTGWHLNLRLGPPDGAKLDLDYHGANLIMRDDRWSMGGGLGMRIEKPGRGPFPSRVTSQLRYFTGSIFFRGLRPSIAGAFDLRGRRRQDVNLERFFYMLGAGTLGLTAEVDRMLFLGAGAGLETRHTFGLEPFDPAVPFTLTRPTSAARTYLLGEVELTFDPAEPRRDHRHVLEGEVSYFLTGPDQGALARMRVRHRIPFFFGFHELRFRSQGLLLTGDTLFTDEEPLDNSFVRGVFGDKYYVQRAMSLASEFRFSLARDLYKLSVFSDLALFGDIDRSSGESRPALATSSGLGFHALVLDAIQVDVYLAFGVDTRGDLDIGLAAWLVQAF